MKGKIILFVLFLIGVALGSKGQGLLIETEQFQEKGGWLVDAQFVDQMGSPYLLAHGLGEPVDDAVTQVIFPEKGHYKVWVRTKDWAPFPVGPGKFKVIIDGKPLKPVFGANGEKGWRWYEGGTIHVSKREIEIRLHDLTGFEGRCDAIYFSKDPDVTLPDDCNLDKFRKTALSLSQTPRNEGTYDLVVVGGGVAGICAAIQAARLGVRVALINNRPVLGGNSSSEIRVGTVGDMTQNKYPKLGQIVRLLDNSIAGLGGRNEKEYGDQQKLELVLKEKNISLFSNMHVNRVICEGTRIKSVIALNLNTLEEHSFSARLFSDCTGDGMVGVLAGADYRYGRESKAETGEADAPEKPDSLTMGTSNQWYATNINEFSSFPIEDWMLPFTDDYHFDITHSEWNWETGFGNFHTIRHAEEIRDHNFRAIYGNWAYLKTRKPEQYGTYKLDYLAHNAGKRESNRILGDLILSQQDVVGKKEYPDAVITTTWGIDLHYPDPENSKRFPKQEFVAYAVHPDKLNDVYTFPYRCLYSRNIDNLFMAGRNISVTHIALGTVRVQHCTGMMGEVVGMAASICIKRNCFPRKVYTSYWNEMIRLLE